MKKCPFCAEEIQSDAVKCRYCGEWINKKASVGADHDQPTEAKKIRLNGVGVNHGSNFLGGIHHPWRRFFARLFDNSTLGVLGCFILGLIIGLIFPDKADGFAKAVDNQIIAGIILLWIWMPIESVLLSTFGSTPGKWLFGISVKTTSGQMLSFSQALARSFRVLLQGLGLGIPLVAPLTQFFAYRCLTKTGATLWDTATDCVITHKTWGTARAFSCTISVLLAFTLMIVLNMEGKTVESDPFRGYFDKAQKVEGPVPVPAPAPALAPAPRYSTPTGAISENEGNQAVRLSDARARLGKEYGLDPSQFNNVYDYVAALSPESFKKFVDRNQNNPNMKGIGYTIDPVTGKIIKIISKPSHQNEANTRDFTVGELEAIAPLVSERRR